VKQYLVKAKRHRRPLTLLLEWLEKQGGRRKRWRWMADSV